MPVHLSDVVFVAPLPAEGPGASAELTISSGSAVRQFLVTSAGRSVTSLAFPRYHRSVHADLAADESLQWIADRTNDAGYDGDVAGAVRDADVFIGVSAPRILTGADIATMKPGSIVFALANPDPEVDPDEAREYAEVVATGRSDYPNQINNVLAFPGVFRGLLDAQSRTITDGMLVAAARALADVVSADELGPNYIVPSVFHPDVASSVAAAVREAAAGPGR